MWLHICPGWTWPLTPEGHLRPKIFTSLEIPYMTSYSISLDTTISLFCNSNSLEKMRGKKFLRSPIHNMEFDLFEVKVMNWFFVSYRRHPFHQTAAFEILRIKIGSAVKGSTQFKKAQTLICWVCVPQSVKSIPKLNFGTLSRLLTWSINFFSLDSLGCLWQGSNFAIFSANRRWPLQLLYYTVVQLWCNLTQWNFLRVMVKSKKSANRLIIIIHNLSIAKSEARRLTGSLGCSKNNSEVSLERSKPRW